MKHVGEMLRHHPTPLTIDRQALHACIEACFECEQVCTACADACLAEEMVSDLRKCIRTDLDCAELCGATGRILSRLTMPDWKLVRAQVESLKNAVQICGDECEQHADMHEHCRVCMEACRACEKSCERLLQEISQEVPA